MPMIERAFGCLPDTPDGRDFLLSVSSPTAGHGAVHLDHPPPLDQGPTKSCVGHGCCLWLEMSAPMTRRSPWFLYTLCLHMDTRIGSWDANVIRQLDRGTTIRTAFQRMARVGVCSLETRATDGRFNPPTAGSLIDAYDLRTRVERYERCDGVADIDRAITAGRPVVVGLNVDDTWWSPPEVLQRPVRSIGAHCVVVVGRDEDGNFIISNSWGEGWHSPSLGPGEARVSRDYLATARDAWTGSVVYE